MPGNLPTLPSCRHDLGAIPLLAGRGGGMVNLARLTCASSQGRSRKAEGRTRSGTATSRVPA